MVLLQVDDLVIAEIFLPASLNFFNNEKYLQFNKCLYSIFGFSLQFLFFVQFPFVSKAISSMCHLEYKRWGY